MERPPSQHRLGPAPYGLIAFFPGRSPEAKRNLYAGIVRRFGELGVSPNDITIALHEPPLDNWGVGGKPASEIDLGFNLKV